MTDTATIAGGPSPLNAHTYNPEVASGSGNFPICTPVRQTTASGAGGHVLPASASASSAASVVGIAAASGVEGQSVRVMFAGPLEATTDQWDAVTGDSGGLVTASPYYAGTTTGTLTTTAPSGPGTLVVAVGIALSPTAMMIQISDPQLNS